MRDDEFKQKLTEVCEWRIPKTLKDTDNRAVRKRPRCDDQANFCINEEIVFTQWDGVNPTYAPEITRLKTQPCTCEDCGKYCENGRHTEIKLLQRPDRRAWREKCVTCGRFQNPYTGEFTLNASMASTKWNDFLRDVKAPKSAKVKKNSDLDPQ